MTINGKILTLPSNQSVWIKSTKKIFQNLVTTNSINIKELIFAIKNKATERGYNEFNLLLDSKDLEEYLKN